MTDAFETAMSLARHTVELLREDAEKFKRRAIIIERAMVEWDFVTLVRFGAITKQQAERAEREAAAQLERYEALKGG